MSVSLSRILNVAKANGGFLTETSLKLLVEKDPMRMILVRCGVDRRLLPAQDVKQFVDNITKENTVRDVSLPASDPIWD